MSDYRDFNINNRSNLFVRFAADEHGTDFSDKPSQNRRYMGILATGHRLNLPIKEDFDGLWQEYVGHDGLNAEVHIDPVTHTWIINGVDTKVVAVAQDTVMAESYCHGQTLARPNEETDNAMYYKQAAEAAASVAEEAVGDIASLHEQIASQNEVIQNHIETTTSLNEEMSEKVAHVDSVLSHIDEVKSDVDTIHANVQSVVGEIDETAQQIANDKSEINTLKSNIDAAASMVSRAANQVSDDKVIIVRASEMANEYKLDAAAAAKEAASYAHGGTNTRQDEDTDNGLYYLTQTRDVATNAIGSVTADVQLVQEAQEDVTAKATLVTQTAEQVATDKSDIADMKATVVEKHDAVVTMHDHVVELQSAVETARVQVNTEYDDILAKASQVSSDTAAVSVMKDWITTNTQISHVYIDEHGVLHENRVGADLFSFSLDENGKLVVTDLKQPNRHAELGVTTAYGYAKAGGYTGTEDDFIARIQEILNATLDTFSGDYNDLTNKPTIPSKTSELTNDSNFQTAQQVQAAVSPKADASALTSHTGNTTVHITASERSSWNAKSNFSGSYNDLTDKPTIPTTAADVGAIPASEKGAANGVAQLDADGKVDVSQFPVAGSSSGQTGGVWTAADNGVSTDSTGKLSIVQAGSDAIAGRSSSTQPIVPSNLNEAVAAAVSDSNHMTLNASQQATAQSVFHVPDIDATGSSLGLAMDPTTYVMTMTLKNASGTTIDTKTVDLPLESMVIGATCTNGVLTLTLQSGATVNVDVSSLVSGLIPSSEKGADNGVATLGNDGKVPAAQLPAIPTALADLTEDATHHTVTADEKSAWNAKSDFSGDYNDLENKPAIPSKTSDLTNDSGFQTSSDVQSAVSGKANASDLTAHTGNTTIHVTAAEKEAWNGKSDFNGSYNSLTDKPTIPTQLSQLAEDSTHRTVTDAEKASWEGKSGFDGDYNNLTNKPTIPATAADVGAISTTEKGANNGVATLGNDGKVPSAQLPPISSVPDPITALVDPTNTTVGVPGQLYLNTYADKAFVCSGSYNAGTAQSPSLRYSWMPIVAGSGGSVWKNVIISQQDNNTVDTSSKPVLIVGNSNTQSQALASTIVGHDITQTICNQSAAVGQHITQNGCGDSLAIGVYISQRVCEAVLMSGLYLTSDSGVPEGASYFGKYNAPSSGNMRVTGGGTADNARKNIEELSSTGDLYITGGYRQGITIIPADTSAYTLSEGVFTHAPTVSPTYTLPDVTDTTRTHHIELIIDFTTVQTFAFVDSSNTTVTIMYSPAISAGDVYAFEMEYNATLSRWTIFPKIQGKTPCVPPPFMGSGYPRNLAKGSSGQWYIDTDTNFTYICTDVPSGTAENPSTTRTWRCVPSGEGGILTRYLAIVSGPQYYYRSNTTRYTLAVGSIVNQSNTTESLAVGQVTQNNAQCSILVGQSSTQTTSCDTSIAVGHSVFQENVASSVAFGINVRQTKVGDSFTVGVGNVESGGDYYLEGMFEAGIFLTNDLTPGSAYFGMFNAPAQNAVRVTGRGESQNARKNIEELSETGDLYITGGYRQAITEIPAATSAYTLAEGVYIHTPASAPTYTLPAVTDATRTRYIELTVKFTNVQSYSFVDSSNTAITPVTTPTISAGDIYTFRMEYSSFLSRWVITPERHGASAYVSDSALAEHTGNTTIHVTSTEKAAWNAKSNFSGSYNDLTNKPTIPSTASDVNAIPVTEKGTNNGVATLGSDGKVPAAQLPESGSAVLTGTTNPATTTVGELGQFYLNTETPSLFANLRVFNSGTEQDPDLRYVWGKVHTGREVTVGRYIAICDEGLNTIGANSIRVLAVGYSINVAAAEDSIACGSRITQQASTHSSVAIGDTITQSSIQQSIAIGQNITQSYLNGSIAAGENIIQESGSDMIAVGLGLTTNTSYAAYFGKYNAPSSGSLRVTGNGTSDSNRKNIEELSSTGDLYITGGYRQAITVIPAATSAYSLAEGVFTHAPSTAPTYTLPAITDTTRTHRIELTVDFTTVQTYTFVNSGSATVTPVFTPAISAGDIYTFKMEYSSVLSRWLVFPEKHGEGAYISASEKGVANGVATLGASAKVPVTQLPYANITSKGILGAKLNSGLLLNSGELSINPAGETAIDSRNTINPLIPQTLDYAVRSVLPNVSFISALTTDYSLLDSSATTNDHSHIYRHTPDSTTVYRLPEVTTPYLKHVIELIVNFAYTTSYSIVDHNGNAVPLAYPLTVALNDIITFKMEYSSFLSRWVIYPERQGSATFLSESALSSHTSDTTVHVTSAEKTAWNAKSNFSGSYNDLTNKPTVPTALSDLTQTASYRTVTDAEKTEWSGKVSGITLNGEDLEQDEDGIVNISALAVVHTTVPNANTSEQSYMLYLGETNASYKKGHLYERAIEPGTTVAYDRVTVHAYDTEYHFDASNNTTGPWTCNDGNIRLKYEQIGPDTGWWEFTDHTTNDSGYLHNLHSNEVASTDMPWTSAITGWYHEGGNQEIISVTRDVGEEVVSGTDYEWKDLGGSDKEIDEIPSLVTAYSLQEGVARHELGSGYCTYTLPEVRDTSITHEVVVTVMFATATDSCMFLDHDENEITPLSTPEIEAGTVVSYLCSYDAFLESWAIMPVVYGKKEV